MRFSTLLAAGLSLAALNSQAVNNVNITSALTYQQGANSVYDYTLTLTNTGPESVSSLWLGWIVGVFDIASPTAPSSSLGWTASIQGNSIQFGAGTPLAAGDSATFTFDSTSTPAQFAVGTAGPSVVYGVNATAFAIENTTADSEEFTPAIAVSINTNPPATIKQKLTYSGLFWDTNNLSNASSGWFSATVATNGVIDGQVKLAGVTTSFAGKLNASGAVTLTLPRSKKDSLILTVQVDLSGSGVLTGSVADADQTFNSPLTAYGAVFSTKSPATADEGSYTWAMPAVAGVAPAGNSFGSATISATGNARLSLSLGDGTTTSAAGALSTNGLFPLYVSLYNGQGSFLAWVSFNKASVATNSAIWFKEPLTLFKTDSAGDPIPLKVAAGQFPAGFTLTNLLLYTAVYHAPAKGANALDASSVAIQLSGADLSNSLSATIPLKSSGVGASNGVSLSISGSTGLFSGSFKDETSEATVQFHGAALQPWTSGFGSFVGGGLNGAVVIEPNSALLPEPVDNLQISPDFNQSGNILISDQWNNRVIEVTPAGRIVWSFGLGPLDFSSNSPISVNDAERVGDLTLMANPGDAPGVIPQATNGAADNRVMLVDPVGNVLWQYGQFGQSGSDSNLLNLPVQATFVPPFNVLITDQANNRIIEVNYNKEIVWQYPGADTNAADQLNGPNSAEALPNGHILIADQGNNRALEVNSAGQIVDTFSAGGTVNIMAFASRLPNGDTLLTDGANARIVEVNAKDKVVWQYYTTNNVPHAPAGSESVAAPQPTRAIRLANGNTIISDQLNNRVITVNHAGKIVADYGLPLPADGGTFSGGSAGILIGDNFGFGLFSTQEGMYSPYDAKVIGDFTGLTSPSAPAKSAAQSVQPGY